MPCLDRAFVDVITTAMTDDVHRELEASADPATLARLQRLRVRAGRDAMLVAHRGVRRLVARLADVPDEDVAITRSCPTCGGADHGKPSTLVRSSDGDYRSWHVSLSHTDGLAVVAGATVEVGVDAERRPRSATWAEIGSRVFSARERDVLAPRADTADGATFWVRKEAVVKCTGAGLTAHLRAIDVAGIPASGGWAGGPHRLWVTDVPAGDEHAAALAATAVAILTVRHLSAADLL